MPGRPSPGRFPIRGSDPERRPPITLSKNRFPTLFLYGSLLEVHEPRSRTHAAGNPPAPPHRHRPRPPASPNTHHQPLHPPPSPPPPTPLHPHPTHQPNPDPDPKRQRLYHRTQQQTRMPPS